MCRSQQIKNGFDGIECFYRYFYKQGVPVRHRTVPESRELQRLECVSFITLLADESCLIVHVIEEIETLAVVVFETAYQIYRIEVRGRVERFERYGV